MSNAGQPHEPVAEETAARPDAEARLQAANAELERQVALRTEVFDHSPLALTLFDGAAGHFVDVNEAAVAMFGYARDELLQMTPQHLGAWDDPVRVAAARAELQRSGRTHHWEATLRRRSGATFPAVLHFTDMTVAGARLRLAAIEDVSAQRELQDRAIQAQKLQVVGQLAGGVAHDFNNVLTVITSTADLALLDTPHTEPAHQALQAIRRASTRAAQLTAQLLAVARRQILQPATIDLNDVVLDVAAMVRGLAGENVVVAVVPSATPSLVWADRASVDQVLWNLAINALDAMPGGGTLSLRAGVEQLHDEPRQGTTLPPGRYATVTVRDTGVGMSADVQRHIFEPFFTTKDVGKGTGLGLAMAHGVVSQSGGEIAVTSAPGAGATFTVRLPAVGGQTGTAADQAAPLR